MSTVVQTGTMTKRESVGVDGVVAEALPNAMFRVALEGAGQRSVMAHVAGGSGKNFVRLLPGDRVVVELARHDVTRGRIVRRHD
jgi:translation initiation factor IF-1|tara:strand:+ start:4859 stop:5110 length:252 start_codon:yes stop_codon:yes gene_type:complete